VSTEACCGTKIGSGQLFSIIAADIPMHIVAGAVEAAAAAAGGAVAQIGPRTFNEG